MVAVVVEYDDSPGLALAFEPPSDATERSEAGDDRVRTDSGRDRGSHHTEGVRRVVAAGRRKPDAARAA